MAFIIHSLWSITYYVTARVRDAVHSRLVQVVSLVALPKLCFGSMFVSIMSSLSLGYFGWPKLQLELSVMYHNSFSLPNLTEDYEPIVDGRWTFYKNLRQDSYFTSIRSHTDLIASYDNGAKIFLGALPLQSQGLWLVSQGIKHIICLTERWEVEEVPEFIAKVMTRQDWEEKGVAVHDFPYVDGSVILHHDLQQINDIVIPAIQRGESVLFHCQAGKGRSAQAAIATLCKMTGKSVDEMYSLIAKARPQVSLDSQRKQNLISFLSLD